VNRIIGAYGIVYKGVYRGQTVAVKKMEHLDNAQMKMFASEADIMRFVSLL